MKRKGITTEQFRIYAKLSPTGFERMRKLKEFPAPHTIDGQEIWDDELCHRYCLVIDSRTQIARLSPCINAFATLIDIYRLYERYYDGAQRVMKVWDEEGFGEQFQDAFNRQAELVMELLPRLKNASDHLCSFNGEILAGNNALACVPEEGDPVNKGLELIKGQMALVKTRMEKWPALWVTDEPLTALPVFLVKKSASSFSIAKSHQRIHRCRENEKKIFFSQIRQGYKNSLEKGLKLYQEVQYDIIQNALALELEWPPEEPAVTKSPGFIRRLWRKVF